MQTFGVLALAGLMAGVIPLDRPAPIRADIASPIGEAYVAVLDADWNVTREIRVACPVEAGCAVDLDLVDVGVAAVHVRFDPLRSGAVAVSSRLEGRDGSASAAEDKMLSLDRNGFGAGHYEARLTATGGRSTTIMVAMKVPGWTAPVAHAQQPI